MKKLTLVSVVLIALVLNRLYRDIISAHHMVGLALAEIIGERGVP